MWLARDWNGVLHLFKSKPHLTYGNTTWNDNDVKYEIYISIPEVTFESSPIEVELKIKI